MKGILRVLQKPEAGKVWIKNCIKKTTKDEFSAFNDSIVLK